MTSEAPESHWKPNLFVPGFEKCGTTALCAYLEQHPDIYFSAEKEPDTLFDDSRVGMSAYRQLFEAHRHYRYRAEGSQSYTRQADFARRLKDFAPEAKIILMIRDPIKRAVSTYLYSYHSHGEHDFNRYMDRDFRLHMNRFMISEKIAAFYELFSRNLLVVENRSLQSAPVETLQRVFQFLDLPPRAVQDVASNVNVIRASDSLFGKEIKARLFRASRALGYPVKWAFQKTGLYNRPVGIALRRYHPYHALTRVFSFGSGTLPPATPDDTRLISQIPSDLHRLLEEDYWKAREFCAEKNILVDLASESGGLRSGIADGR